MKCVALLSVKKRDGNLLIIKNFKNTVKLCKNFAQKSSAIRQKGESQNECFKQSMLNFQKKKKKISYPLIHTRTYACKGVRMFVFWKACHALFCWNTRFKIRPFVLLLTKYFFLRVYLTTPICFIKIIFKTSSNEYTVSHFVCR